MTTDPTGGGAEREPSDSPIDRLLDAAVFAPLGFILERRSIVAQLAETGRSQVAFSRSLGKAALRTIAKGAKGRSGDAGSRHPSTVAEPPDVDQRVDYGALSARELVALAATCSDSQADRIRAAESTGKKRITVLRALDARAR